MSENSDEEVPNEKVIKDEATEEEATEEEATEEATKEETCKEGPTQGEVTKEDSFKEESSNKDAPKVEASKGEESNDEAPNDEALIGEAPQEESTKEVVKEEESKEEAAKSKALKEGTVEREEPKKDSLAEAASQARAVVEAAKSIGDGLVAMDAEQIATLSKSQAEAIVETKKKNSNSDLMKPEEIETQIQIQTEALIQAHTEAQIDAGIYKGDAAQAEKDENEKAGTEKGTAISTAANSGEAMETDEVLQESTTNDSKKRSSRKRRRDLSAVDAASSELLQRVEGAEEEIALAQENLQAAQERVLNAAVRMEEIRSECVRTILQDHKKADWAAMYIKLERYAKEHGNCNVSRDFPDQMEKELIENGTYDDIHQLGMWVYRQRFHRRTNPETYEHEKIIALDRLGFDWDPRHTHWMTRFEELKQFQQYHGSNWYQTLRAKGGNEELVRWVKKQRFQYKARNEGKTNVLTDEKIELLNAINFDWRIVTDHSWEDKFKDLEAFAKKYRHFEIEAEDDTEDNGDLAKWCKTQRKRKLKKMKGEVKPNSVTITDEQEDRLTKLGFFQSFSARRWLLMLQKLRAYRQANGHCNVPSEYLADKTLANWVATQRNEYRKYNSDQDYKCSLNEQRIRMLNELNFSWIAERKGKVKNKSTKSDEKTDVEEEKEDTDDESWSPPKKTPSKRKRKSEAAAAPTPASDKPKSKRGRRRKDQKPYVQAFMPFEGPTMAYTNMVGGKSVTHFVPVAFPPPFPPYFSGVTSPGFDNGTAGPTTAAEGPNITNGAVQTTMGDQKTKNSDDKDTADPSAQTKDNESKVVATTHDTSTKEASETKTTEKFSDTLEKAEDDKMEVEKAKEKQSNQEKYTVTSVEESKTEVTNTVSTKDYGSRIEASTTTVEKQSDSKDEAAEDTEKVVTKTESTNSKTEASVEEKQSDEMEDDEISSLEEDDEEGKATTSTPVTDIIDI